MTFAAFPTTDDEDVWRIIDGDEMTSAILIRRGTLNEALLVLAQVDELAQGRPLASFEGRLSAEHLILVAECDGQLVGFKIGYALDSCTFYSWIGGISPLFRRQGVGQALLETQQNWAKRHGYCTVEVKSSDAFPQMLSMLRRNEYLFIKKLEGKQLYRKSLISS